MGLLDGFPFRSKEEQARRKREFDNRVMPLGVEQKDLAQAVLVELKPKGSRNDPRELLFAYLVSKDKYMDNGKGEDGSAAMNVELKKLKYLSDYEKNAVRTLVRLDSEIDDLKDYPSAAKVRTAIELIQS